MTSPLDRIADLAGWIAAARIDVLTLAGPDGHVRLTRAGADSSGLPAPETDVAPTIADPVLDRVASPGVGHFLSAHPLRNEALAEPGEPVTAGQTIGLLRVGTLLLPVSAPRNGIVVDILAPDGTLVGYGDPLLSLRSEG